MNSGQKAEAQVADYLAGKGHKILDRNWRNRWCEIDIVTSYGRRKNKSIHFVEVKYRKNSLHGSGFDYITKRKADQLKKAALNWVNENGWSGDYCIDVAAVDGMTDDITYLENAVQG